MTVKPDWHSAVLHMLFRPSLAGLIEAKGGLRDDGLLAAAYQFAPDHDTMMTVVRQVRDGTSDPAVSAWASDILVWQENLLRDFGMPEPGIIYEAYVKMRPDLCDESCLCASFEGALSAVRSMIASYDDYCPENPDSRYRVVRRRVLTDGEAASWDGDRGEGEAVYLPGMRLYRLDLYRDRGDGADDGRHCQERACTHDCGKCEQKTQTYSVSCRTILFPRGEFNDRGAALWTDPRTAEKRFVLTWLYDGTDDPCDCLYVIPLSPEYVGRRQLDDDFMKHEHIEPPFLEPVDPSALTPGMRAHYEALSAYLTEWEEKNK